MKKLTVLIMIFVFGFVGLANALTLTFDNINVSYSGYGYIPHPYEGFQITHAIIRDPLLHYYTSGYNNAVVSFNNILSSQSSQNLGISNEDYSFYDLNSLYLTAAYRDNLEIIIRGRDNSDYNRYYRETIIINTQTPTFVELNWTHVNYVYFARYNSGINIYNSPFGLNSQTNFAIDNITFNEPIQSAPVPEPATILLMGVGLMGIIGIQKKRNFKNV